MKEIKLTEKQEIVKEVLNRIKDKIALLNQDRLYKSDLKEVYREIERDYELIPKYQTLREYISEHENGAYHDFIFTINGISINVCGVREFGRIYNERLLDQYLVVEDKQNDNGGNCENYTCYHRLTIKYNED